MSNFFDQFDQAPQGNYFDQFDAPEPVAGSPSNPRRYTNPNRGKSSLELAGRGSFKFLNDVSLARRQMMTDVAGLFGADVAEEKNRLEGIADARKLDPTLHSGWGQLGYGATAAVPAVAASIAAPGYGGAALGGAALGALQPTGTNDSRITNTVTSTGLSLLGQGAFNAIGRVAQPVKSGLNRAESRAVQFLKDRGVNLSVGQETGSRVAQAVERTLGDIPSSTPTMARQGDKFRDSFTRAALRTAGINADNATPEVMGPARDRIGGAIGDIYERHALDVNNMLADLTSISDEASRVLPDGGRQILSQVDRIINKAENGRLDGRTAHKIWQELAKVQKQPLVGEYATELRELLDDSLQTAARGTGDFAALKTARSQYRNLMALADVADTTANGRISPAALASRLKSNTYTRNSMRFGKGDAELARLARAGSTVVDRFPQSGTAPRSAAIEVAKQVAAPVVAGGASYAADRDLRQAALIAGGVWALPKAGAWAMTQPGLRNYLARGVPQEAVRNFMLAPSRLGVGAAVPAYLLSQE